jgi:hypothetical protein
VLAVTLVTSTFGTRARAGHEDSLMVAVEVEPELGIDAGEVRSAIGAELHRPVVAPAAAPKVDAEDVLLVSMSGKRTVVSFRGASRQDAARAIPTPADRAGRLRAVAWLAGNLARDQVSPVVVAAALSSKEAGQAHATSVEAEGEVADAAAAERRDTVPPPVADNEPTQVRAAAPDRPRREPTWAIMLSGGTAMAYDDLRGARGTPNRFDGTAAYHLEVEHTQAGGWLLGAAIDYGPRPRYGPGYAATVGLAQYGGPFRFEESLGLGFGSGYARNVNNVTTTSSLTGQSSTTTISTSSEGQLYARLFVRASLPVWRSWGLVANLGLRGGPFAASTDILAEGTIGARLELP